MINLEIWVVESDVEMAGRVQKALTTPYPILGIKLQKSRLAYGYFHFVAQCASQDFVNSLTVKLASTKGIWINQYPPGLEKKFKAEEALGDQPAPPAGDTRSQSAES